MRKSWAAIDLPMVFNLSRYIFCSCRVVNIQTFLILENNKFVTVSRLEAKILTMYLKWPGFNEKDSVIIELAAELFCHSKNTIDVHGELFTLKKEFHVTLIGSKLGLIIQDKIKHNQTINKLLEKIFEEIDWSYKLTGPVHILSRSAEDVVEKSVIMLIEMPGLTTFYDQSKALGLIGLETPVPPPHVTMYTQNCPSGIGVPSDDALYTLSGKTISLNSLNKLCE